MPTAHKRGNSWRCQVFSHYEYKDGKKVRKYESFTCGLPGMQGKRECERMAAEWLVTRDQRTLNITVRDAVERYIASKEGVLKPDTIAEYRRRLNYDYKDIESYRIKDLTKQDLQTWVSMMATKKTAKGTLMSPKSVRNSYGLLHAALLMFDVEFAVTLPQKIKPQLYTPTDEELKILMDSVKGDEDLYNAVLLAAFCSLRRSEICALTANDIIDGRISVNKVMVMDTDRHTWVVSRFTKTTESTRMVDVPEFVLKRFIGKEGHLVDLSPSQVTKRFIHARGRAGLPHFRFHDLRSYYVSISAAIGIPLNYTMEAGGWKSDRIIKRTYMRTLKDRKQKEFEKLNTYLSDEFGG